MGKKHSEELSVKVVDYPNMVYASWTDGTRGQDSVTKPRIRRLEDSMEEPLKCLLQSNKAPELPRCPRHDPLDELHGSASFLIEVGQEHGNERGWPIPTELRPTAEYFEVCGTHVS